MPQENLDLRHYPLGWASPGFRTSAESGGGGGWAAATVAKLAVGETVILMTPPVYRD